MKIAILGMGAYGIALAKVFYKNENDVVIWTKFKEELESVEIIRENRAVLPGVKIPTKIKLTCNMQKCVENADIIVVAIPMNAVRNVLKDLHEFLDKKQVVCLVTKGIEEGSGEFVSNIAQEELEGTNNICMLSGPSIASELADGSDIGLNVASPSNFAILTVKVCLENENIVVIPLNDMIGIQVASAVKNVFAIFCGYADAKGYSDSLKAALLSKLIKDMRLLIKYFGGNDDTLFEYAGLGDMLLTCMSSKSRNYTFGKMLGSGYKYDNIFKKMNVTTVEGISTLNILHKMLVQKNVKVKSINTLYDIIYNGYEINNILKDI